MPPPIWTQLRQHASHAAATAPSLLPVGGMPRAAWCRLGRPRAPLCQGAVARGHARCGSQYPARQRHPRTERPQGIRPQGILSAERGQRGGSCPAQLERRLSQKSDGGRFHRERHITARPPPRLSRASPLRAVRTRGGRECGTRVVGRRHRCKVGGGAMSGRGW